MKVCHIITRMILGGAQENTFLTCKGLAERGWDVSLLAGPQTGAEGSLQERCRQEGFRFEIIEPMLRQVSPLNDWRAMRAMRVWLEREKPRSCTRIPARRGSWGGWRPGGRRCRSSFTPCTG